MFAPVVLMEEHSLGEQLPYGILSPMGVFKIRVDRDNSLNPLIVNRNNSL